MSVEPITSRIDPIDVWYVFAREHVSPDVARTVMGFEAWRDALVFDHPRMRRVILRHPAHDGGPPRHNRFGAVHWNDGSDLDDLDARARDGQDITGDLDSGIWCEVHPVTDISCGQPSVVAAVRVATSAVTSARLHRNRPSSHCPACGADGFPTHVEVLERG